MLTFGVVLITCPPDKAEAISRAILEKRVAACVNILSGVSSLYWWANKITSDKEALLIVKTRSDAFDDLKRVVREVHPYDVPEIVLLQMAAGNSDYLDWVDRETKPLARGA